MPTDSKNGLRCKRQGNELHITLSRPQKGNALTLATIQDLTAKIQAAAEDKAIFRILLAAEGKYFCVGMDLGGTSGGILEADAETKQRQWLMIQQLFQAIERSPRVTIAILNGPAHGAGVGLAFACDIRIATENADFHVGEAKLGMTPAVIMQLILREWGLGRAREAMLTARPVKPRELEAAGVVHAVVDDPSKLHVAVNRYVGYLDACGPEALSAIKKSVLASETERPAMLKGIYDIMMEPSEEARHGIGSFQAKKSPEWSRYYSKFAANL